MERIAVDALLLRAQLPELVLREGVSVVARVAARAEQHGVLVLAGLPLTAKLPDGIQAGETLRLTVSEVTAERITLRMDPAAAALAPPPPPPPQPVRVEVDQPPRRAPGAERDAASVVLAFHSDALGRLDLRVEVAEGRVEVGVVAPSGRSYELAASAADELRAVLREHVAARAQVLVERRREPLDVYA